MDTDSSQWTDPPPWVDPWLLALRAVAAHHSRRAAWCIAYGTVTDYLQAESDHLRAHTATLKYKLSRRDGSDQGRK